jgi:hypothetical protein
MDVLARAWADSLALFEQNPRLLLLGVLGAIVTALLVLLFRGREAFMEHLKANIAIVFGGALLTWMLVFVWILVSMPSTIRKQADSLQSPVLNRKIIIPSDWATKSPNKSSPPPNKTDGELAEQVAQKLHEDEVKRTPPIIKRGTFNTLIPFVVHDYYGEVPNETMEAIDRDPLGNTYLDLTAIAELPRKREIKDHMAIISPLTLAERTDFLGRILQYYLLSSIVMMQYARTTGNYTQGQGTTLNPTYVVAVPDEEEMSAEEAKKVWSSLKLNFRINAGGNDWVWRHYKLKVPTHTKVSVTETPQGDTKIYVVRFERNPDFTFDLTIIPSGFNSGIGTMPRYFQLADPEDAEQAFCHIFRVDMKFQWNSDHSLIDPYLEWANGLFVGLRQKLVIPDQP